MYKEPYNRQAALAKIKIHAEHFLQSREAQVEQLFPLMGGRDPIVVSPYDAELFGHWWYEGPEFLDTLVRRIAQDSKILTLITPMEYLERFPDQQVAQPSFSSWGNKGYSEVWLNESNDWIYRHLHKACERMNELANTHPSAEGLEKRALDQAARELLLAQSSDWAFIMKTNTMVEYAIKRTKGHINHFTDLYYAIKGKNIDEDFLRTLERRNTIFPEIDYHVYCDTAGV
jgi:1,4-alpha-glucan branching enzyme